MAVRPVPARLGPAPSVQVACAGRGDEWDGEEMSAEMVERARHVCRTCPGLEWCGDQVRLLRRAGLEPVGVWAGVAYPVDTARSSGVVA